ncbi:DUF2235 domain-containing protein [Hafnia alvei]|uniref:Uncharacterized alpha/beta hydrolase domain (DUF2235) n=1 Tax=Hafnia alvei TaxID=569 RepID=A0A1C6YVJ3_HAFAL|nr:DUF2235 domain-containing protein [Hafnia alvei]NLS56347.1 hypothetical protein [Hafnia alvei]SCM50863.1 Uncharacterized alpha/beta hydrolase domain (DUF2235) [Hafnia alvei]
MEIDLDAVIAAAHRAQQSCDYRLGNCSRILHVGFFFDGVERNIEQDAPANRLSNVARLFRAYPEEENKTDLVAYKKHYISGLGTPFDEATAERLQGMMDKSLGSLLDDLKDKPADMAKEAFQSSLGGTSGKDVLTEMKDTLLTPKGRLGLLKDSAVNALKRVSIEATPWLRDSAFMAYNFVTGADTRLNSTKARFVRSFEDAVKDGEVPVRLISVSVFGFDMGGTLARQFIDMLLGEICDKKTGGNPTFRGVPVDIVFAGLFDCSRDTPESSDDGLDYAASAVSWLPGAVAKTAGTVGALFGRKYLEHMSPLPAAVKNSLHLVAAHERRRWRCIYRTGRDGFEHQELLMPGCSEDIGGGLKPDVQKPSAELCRVSLRKMYTEAMKATVPFPDFSTLYKTDRLVWAYFDLSDEVGSQSAEQWVKSYQSAVNATALSYGAMNRHLDGYFEWLGRQFYEYKSELRRLESIHSSILLSPGASMGLSITPQARQASGETAEEIRILEKHWGWLSDVANAAHLLLTQKYHYPPQLYLDNILMPARVRAKYFLECGVAGHDGKSPPIRWCVDSSVLYAWFVHDVQRAEGINDGYFSVRWMEPRG